MILNITSRAKMGITLAGIICAAVVGLFRYITGPELAFSIIYLFPILTVTWFAGRKPGMLIAFISAGSWLIADFLIIKNFSSPYIPVINEFFRLIVFVLITYSVSKLKTSLEKQAHLALTDDLTQIDNHRAFFQAAERELSRTSRKPRPLSVAYLDIDNFKNVNDTLGHKYGDRVLVLVASTLKQNMRAMDVVARIGGDEFVVMFPETDAVSARIVGDKLLTKLKDLGDQHNPSLTFSIGVVTFNTGLITVDEIIGAADTLMYSVKKESKNNVAYQVVDSIH